MIWFTIMKHDVSSGVTQDKIFFFPKQKYT